MISSLVVSFLLTVVIEYVIVKLLCIKRNVFIPVLLVNMLTNPLVVYIYNIIYFFEYKDIVLAFLELLWWKVIFINIY